MARKKNYDAAIEKAEVKKEGFEDKLSALVNAEEAITKQIDKLTNQREKLDAKNASKKKSLQTKIDGLTEEIEALTAEKAEAEEE
jgi:chromosome segregation ATPase